MESFDIINILKNLVLIIPALMFAIIIHEFGHGYVAYKLGDDTPKLAGRLTFNPIPHIDPIGTIILPLVLILLKSPIVFGWAKPVPVNPYKARKIRDYRKAMAIISLAGPGANLLSAVAFAILFHLTNSLSGAIISALGVGIAQAILKPLLIFFIQAVKINIILAIFNLLPIPSFDGWKILLSQLPRDLEAKLEPLEQYGIIILVVLLITHIIDIFLIPPYRFLVSLLLGGY